MPGLGIAEVSLISAITCLYGLLPLAAIVLLYVLLRRIARVEALLREVMDKVEERAGQGGGEG